MSMGSASKGKGKGKGKAKGKGKGKKEEKEEMENEQIENSDTEGQGEGKQEEEEEEEETAPKRRGRPAQKGAKDKTAAGGQSNSLLAMFGAKAAPVEGGGMKPVSRDIEDLM